KVVLAGLAMEPGSSKPALLVGLLRLLALGRLHRVASFVAMIEYRMLLPQAALILLRNNLYLGVTLKSSRGATASSKWIRFYQDRGACSSDDE
ncbi:hypothetical protein HaLaN_04648, partial [Haematococcus lacustris]